MKSALTHLAALLFGAITTGVWLEMRPRANKLETTIQQWRPIGKLRLDGKIQCDEQVQQFYLQDPFSNNIKIGSERGADKWFIQQIDKNSIGVVTNHMIAAGNREPSLATIAAQSDDAILTIDSAKGLFGDKINLIAINMTEGLALSTEISTSPRLAVSSTFFQCR